MLATADRASAFVSQFFLNPLRRCILGPGRDEPNKKLSCHLCDPCSYFCMLYFFSRYWPGRVVQ